MTDREEFLEIFRTHVTRPGSEKLLDWMDSKTDFFSAPASTRFHGACEGGRILKLMADEGRQRFHKKHLRT